MGGIPDDRPPPRIEWFVLKAALIVFMLGMMAGMYWMYEIMTTGRKTEPRRSSELR